MAGWLKFGESGVDAGAMDGARHILASAGSAWVLLIAAVIAAGLVLLCLRALGHNLFQAVRWHNLKVEAHNLRLRQQRELMALRRQAIVKEAKRLGRSAAANAKQASQSGGGGEGGGDAVDADAPDVTARAA